MKKRSEKTTLFPIRILKCPHRFSAAQLKTRRKQFLCVETFNGNFKTRRSDRHWMKRIEMNNLIKFFFIKPQYSILIEIIQLINFVHEKNINSMRLLIWQNSDDLEDT